MKKYILLFIIILLFYFFIFQYNNSEKEQVTTSQNINDTSPMRSDLDSNIETTIKEDKNISKTKLYTHSDPSKENSPLSNNSTTPALAGKNTKPRTDPITNMPSSYPIKDAAKYFLPPEERRPGHIGGPPPLNFPK